MHGYLEGPTLKMLPGKISPAFLTAKFSRKNLPCRTPEGILGNCMCAQDAGSTKRSKKMGLSVA